MHGRFSGTSWDIDHEACVGFSFVNKTRIAVAGAGSIGLAHMAVAQKSPTCMLSGVVDPAPTAEAVAAKARVPPFKSLDELFDRDRPTA